MKYIWSVLITGTLLFGALVLGGLFLESHLETDIYRICLYTKLVLVVPLIICYYLAIKTLNDYIFFEDNQQLPNIKKKFFEKILIIGIIIYCLYIVANSAHAFLLSDVFQKYFILVLNTANFYVLGNIWYHLMTEKYGLPNKMN